MQIRAVREIEEIGNPVSARPAEAQHGILKPCSRWIYEDCRLNEIEWAPLMSNGAFPDPIHTLKECSLKYNTFTEMNFNRFDFSDGNEIVGSMFAKCEMQLANFKGVELHETEFYQCDLRKADFRDAAGYKVDILGSRLKDAKFSQPEAVNLLADLKIKLS